MATADSSRATVFLTVLSASIIALALAVDATGSGSHTTTLALVLLPVVLLLGITPRATLVAGGVVAFLAVWGTLFPLQRHTLDPLRDTTPRFPTPPESP
jgi:hypothetical protein